MNDDVTVAWNGSTGAAHAADWAAERQGGHGRLRLLQIRPDHERSAAASAGASVRQEVQRLTDAFPDLEVSGTTEFGDAFDLLAVERSDRLLVLGTRAWQQGTPAVAHSFAIRVAAARQGPVVIIPDTATGERGDRVVVGIDGTAAAMTAALTAAEEAVRRDQPLVVVHAWWLTIGRQALLPFEAHFVDTLKAAHRSTLDETADAVARRFPRLELTRLLVHGPVSDVLADVSRFASVLVLGRHDGAVAIPALLGSAARGVLRRRAVPAMLVGAQTHGERAVAPVGAIPERVGV